MKIPIYQIDTFTGNLFSGNPAAVCPLEKWLDESILQSIAAENNQSETAFFVKESNAYRIRWFTPVCEVDLCGHATLASAYVYFRYTNSESETIKFLSRSGELNVTKNADLLSLNLPSKNPKSSKLSQDIIDAVNIEPIEVFKSDDYILIYDNQDQIIQLDPIMEKLKDIDLRGVIVSAPGISCDFVSRFFAPKFGINEDPVTGSAHCSLVPYWSDKLGKNTLHAIQLSKRGGELFCEMKGDRVIISGKVVEYMNGQIILN